MPLTDVSVRNAKPKDKAFVDQVGAKFKESISKAIGNLRMMLEGQTSKSVMSEPSLPASSERFITEAVKLS